jgi:hypothetical protein
MLKIQVFLDVTLCLWINSSRHSKNHISFISKVKHWYSRRLNSSGIILLVAAVLRTSLPARVTVLVELYSLVACTLRLLTRQHSPLLRTAALSYRRSSKTLTAPYVMESRRWIQHAGNHRGHKSQLGRECYCYPLPSLWISWPGRMRINSSGENKQFKLMTLHRNTDRLDDLRFFKLNNSFSIV